MEEQQMIGITEITGFVISQLRKLSLAFKKPLVKDIRPISNIVCYLGNIKNYELNDIIEQIDCKKIVTHSKNIERAMLITGVIRLGLF
jgi:hypothetical protein